MSNPGQGFSNGLGNTLGIAPGHALSGGQHPLMNQGLHGAQSMSPYAQQSSAQAAAIQAQHWNSIHARQHAPKKWRVDGQDMDFDEFVKTVFPEDTAEKTFFLLRYTK